MKKLLFALLLAGIPLFATDRPVACGDAAGLSAAVAAAVPGDTITLATNNGAQCVYTLSTLNLTKKAISHPTAEAVLTATVAGDAITSCSVSSGGSGYTIVPTVRIVGGGGKVTVNGVVVGGGTGAAAHVTISGGSVNSCVVDAGGSGYGGAPGPLPSLIPVSSENYITIRTDQYAVLPPSGRRYQPANHATLSPKLVFTSTSPITIDAPSVFGLYDGGAYWKLQGLEMTISNAGAVSVFAAIAGGSHFIFDQNYVYPQPCPNTTAPYNTNGRIVWAVSSYDVQITDNYYDCGWGTPPGAVAGSTGQDSMAVICDTYCEGMTIDNNYLTGWFNGVFLGGGDPPASATGASTVSSRAAGSATLVAPPAAVSLIALELPFEGNTVPISSISRSSNIVTVVTSGAHGFLTGAYVYPKGVTDTSFNVTYDGTGAANCTVRNDTGCRLITVVNSTTFTYSQTGANATSSGGVIVPTTCQRGPGFKCFMDTNVSSVAGNTVNFAHGWVGAFAWGTFDVIATVPNLLVKSGGDARWAGPQPTNVDITRNQFQRNSTFDAWVVANNGNVGKGCPGEFKIWNGGRMEGNTCQGFPLNTPAFNGNTQYGSAPWVTISNLTIANNWWQRFIGSFFTAVEYEPLTPGNRVDVINNLWMIPDNNNASLAAANVKVFSGPSNFSIFNYKHNSVLTGFPFTGFPCTTPGAAGDCYTTLFGQNVSQTEEPLRVLATPISTIQDNLLGVGNYGYQCGINSTLPVSSCTTLTENHNLLVSNSDGTCTLGSTCGWAAIGFPWTNSTNASPVGQPAFCGNYPCMAPTWASVQMTDPQNFNFTLKTISPGYHNASDGTDIGANYAAINTALGPDNPKIASSLPAPTISPLTASIPVQGTQQFSSAGSTFSVNSGCLGSISAAGIFTATSTPESCTVTATQNSQTTSATVTVQPFTITPSTVNMNVGGTQQFSTNFPATWTTGGGLGIVSSSGFYTAPTTDGTYHVTAIAQNGGANAVATITVTGQLNFIPLLTTPIAWNTTTTQSAPVSQVFTVTNQGSGSVTPTVVLTGTGYSITANTCTGPIAGLGTCSITVQFVSATIGFYAGNLQIVDSAGGIQNTPLGVTIPNPAAFHVDPFTSTIAINQTETLVANLPAFYSTNFGTINDVGLFTAPGTAGTATVTATQQSVIVSNLNQTPATSWKNCGNCGDTGGPNGGTHGTFTIIPGDPATFSIVPSQGFDNFFWWQVLGAPGDFNASVDFVLSFEMQFPTQADKNASQAIEFELQKNVLDHQYSMAWQACFACGNKWRVFNKTTHAWEDSGIAINPTDFAGGKWVTIVTTYHLTTGTNTRHVAISVNGVNHVVNINHAPTPAVESDYLHPAFQMDSNSSATPYTVLLRNFNVGTPSATTATATVNVVTVIPNSVSPSSVTLPVSGSQQFTATSSSTWATTCGTLNTTTGTSVIFTAPNSAQSCTITATNTSGGVGTATATAVTLAVNPSSVTMQINSVQQFTANVPVTWSAGCGTIDPVSGKYTAPAAPASCSIVATAQNGGATGTANVTVQNPPPTSTGTHGRGIKHKAKVIR